jgi:hypothetical protein
VENASLFPWLTATALFHSALMHERKGMLKGWAQWLAMATYALCVFGTFLTRSGILQSVHAFPANPLMTATFLALIALTVGVGIYLIVTRREQLAGATEIEEFTSKEGTFLLANILLDDLDKELTRRGHRFVRYADDCNIFVKSKRAGERVMLSVTYYVEGKLKLKVNRDKSAVDRPWKRKFLGFSFLPNKQATIRLALKTIKRFKDKMRVLTSRTKPIPMEERIETLNRYLMGWIGYFQIASAKKHCEELDSWIRRRLRMCLWKQWKRVRTRIRKLRSLGVSEKYVLIMANSRRGCWLMSRNLNNALDTSYWEAQGLKSLLVRYLELRQPLGTA